ncbi:MAG: Hpt domain-containing protein [Pacificimonas sp.]
MEDDDFEIVREELEARLQAMTGLADTAAILRELHSMKGIALAYGFRHFASAAHLLEDRIAEGGAPKTFAEHLAALGRELELSAAA